MPKHWKIVVLVWGGLALVLFVIYVAIRIRLMLYARQITDASYNEMLQLRDDRWFELFVRAEAPLAISTLTAGGFTILSLALGRILPKKRHTDQS